MVPHSVLKPLQHLMLSSVGFDKLLCTSDHTLSVRRVSRPSCSSQFCCLLRLNKCYESAARSRSEPRSRTSALYISGAIRVGRDDLHVREFWSALRGNSKPAAVAGLVYLFKPPAGPLPRDPVKALVRSVALTFILAPEYRQECSS